MIPIDPNNIAGCFSGGDGLTVHQRLAARFTAAYLVNATELSYDETAEGGIKQADAFIETYNRLVAKRERARPVRFTGQP